MKKETEKIEIPFGAKDSELYKFEYTIPDGYEAEIKDRKVIVKKKDSEDEKIRQFLVNEVLGHVGMLDIEGDKVVNNTRNELWKKALSYLERQKEQKPVEWSEEDKAMLNNIIWGVHMKSINPLDEMDDMSKYEKYENFLKALPERFNLPPKQEWSEEDEAAYNAFICEVINEKMNPTIEQIKWLRSICDRLKSLRPQPHWKPSKKQIDALNAIILTGSFTYVGQTQDLISLKDEIKKLL